MLDQLDTSHFTQMIQGCPVGIALVNDKQTITWLNPALQNLLGDSAEQIIQQPISALPAELQELFLASATIHVPANEERDDLWLMCSQQTINERGLTVHYMIDIGPLYLLMQFTFLLETIT